MQELIKPGDFVERVATDQEIPELTYASAARLANRRIQPLMVALDALEAALTSGSGDRELQERVVEVLAVRRSLL
jgi:hypothetical protein